MEMPIFTGNWFSRTWTAISYPINLIGVGTGGIIA
jgi:hypothetical protein